MQEEKQTGEIPVEEQGKGVLYKVVTAIILVLAVILYLSVSISLRDADGIADLIFKSSMLFMAFIMAIIGPYVLAAFGAMSNESKYSMPIAMISATIAVMGIVTYMLYSLDVINIGF